MDNPELDQAFSALADSTRRAILFRLSEGEADVGQIGEPFDISGPAISRHLRVLESAGLIARRREGQRLICRLQPHALRTAAEWLAFYRRFWLTNLDQLAEHLNTRKAPISKTPEKTGHERKHHDNRKTKRR